MSTHDQARRQLWLIALKEKLETSTCPICNQMFEAISKYSYVWISDDLDLHADQSGGYIHLGVGLHSGCRLFPEVFKSKTNVQEGDFKGECPLCGRGFKYYDQPKSADVALLSIQCRQPRVGSALARASKQLRKTRPVNAPSLSPTSSSSRPVHKPQKVKRPPVRPSEVELFRAPTPSAQGPQISSPEQHERFIQGPPQGGEWAQKLEHQWTVRWDREVSLEKVWPTPKVLWVEIRHPKEEDARPEVVGLDRQTGDLIHRSFGASLIASDAEIVLVKPQNRTLPEFALESSTGKRLWESDKEVALKGLARNAVLAVDRFTNALVISRTSDGGRELGPWVQPYESDTYTLKSVLSRGGYWSAGFDGSSKKIEVRHPKDFSVLWQFEFGFAPEDKTYVTPDPWGWVVRQHKKIRSYRRDGELACEFPGPGQLSCGPRFVVGQYKGEIGGIWGAAEPSLGAFDRWTGESLALSQSHFRNRRCFCLSGDVLWCVCESETFLRGYDLASKKLVREITPLPIQAGPRRSPAKIQFFAKYHRDLYLTSKAGYLLAFRSDEK